MAQEKEMQPRKPEVAENFVAPMVDIYETSEGLVLLADIPGVRNEDVDVQIDNDILTLTARIRAEEPKSANWVAREFCSCAWRRSFELSRDIDRQAVKGKVENGVLRLELPKATAAKARKISIQSGDR